MERVPLGDGIVRHLTQGLATTLCRCNSQLDHAELSYRYRRCLTEPQQTTGVNDGMDNEEGELVLSVGDILTDPTQKNQYTVQDILGKGTFGQVVRCKLDCTGKTVAVKVIKNQTAYWRQALVEVQILGWINQHLDPTDCHHMVRMEASFTAQNHLCIVFEQLHVSLFDLLKTNRFAGVSTNLIRVIMTQMVNHPLLLLHPLLSTC